jgi:hypothetical protein
MIGYGRYQYTVKSSPAPVSWPILGLALQKNYISLYNSANGDGRASADVRVAAVIRTAGGVAYRKRWPAATAQPWVNRNASRRQVK